MFFNKINFFKKLSAPRIKGDTGMERRQENGVGGILMVIQTDTLICNICTSANWTVEKSPPLEVHSNSQLLLLFWDQPPVSSYPAESLSLDISMSFAALSLQQWQAGGAHKVSTASPMPHFQ